MIEQFDYFCKECNEKTPHKISKIFRNKGVKLVCTKCFKECSRYINLNKLQKFKHEEIKDE